ncbi:LOW QUALITY PROTEIN: hypothetical protein YC2023_044418 [Brassica napus]
MKDLYEKDKLDEVTDPFYTKMVKDMTSGQRFQMEACVALAMLWEDESRPKMIEAAKELKRIQTSLYRSSLFLDYKANYFTGSEAYPVGLFEYVKGLYENKKLNEVINSMMMRYTVQVLKSCRWKLGLLALTEDDSDS